MYNIVCLGCEQWYSDNYVNPSTRICSVMAHVHNSEYSSVHISMCVPVCRVAMLKNNNNVAHAILINNTCVIWE